MSHILLKKIHKSSVTPPDTNYIKLFSNLDDGFPYYLDSSGLAKKIGESLLDFKFETLIYSELYNKYTCGNLNPGSYYLIKDFDSVYDQPDFYIDGTPKSNVMTKGKPSGWTYQPILVLAVSKDKLSPYAFQPSYEEYRWDGYTKDRIIYDITFNTTEISKSGAKGRITERIDEFGNRTDYDHRTIRFKRYQEYVRNSKLSGYIKGYNCSTGVIVGVDTKFSTEVSIGDVILVNSIDSLGYQIGVIVSDIKDDLNILVSVDTSYNSIVFNDKSYDIYLSSPTKEYNQYKEVYISQSILKDFDDVYTFQFASEISSGGCVTSVSNYIGNNKNDEFILSNNVFGSDFYSNKTGDIFSNNTIGDSFQLNNINFCFFNNIISSHFRKNNISSVFSGNKIGSHFESNIIDGYFISNDVGGGFENNRIHDIFENNKTSSNFQYNCIKNKISGIDFTKFYGSVNNISISKIGVGNIDGGYEISDTSSSNMGYGFTVSIIFKDGVPKIFSQVFSGNCYKVNDIIKVDGTKIGGESGIGDMSFKVTGIYIPHVYSLYNCDIFKNNKMEDKLLYYNGNIPTVTDVIY